MNRKSIAALTVVAVFSLPDCCQRISADSIKVVKISMDSHHRCTQTDQHGIPLPLAIIDPGDRVQWLTGIGAKRYTVSFSGPNLPFPGNNKFDDGHTSMGATNHHGDHRYNSVTMHIAGNDTPCTNNPMDMGVHIN
jgi:hypothetical protein